MSPAGPAAADVAIDGDMLTVSLSDGREVSVAMSRVPWLRWLREASPEDRGGWSLEPNGFAVYWEDLDDGFEVRHLLSLQPLA